MTRHTPNTRGARALTRPGGWLLTQMVFALMLAGFAASGCQPEASNCQADSDCEPGLHCASGGGLLVSGGVCVSRSGVSKEDAGPDDTRDEGEGPDGSKRPDGGTDIQECVPKSCEAFGATCGVVDDGCGAPLQCGAADCVASLSAGPEHTCAVLGDGRIYCWGANEGGQLGSGDFEPRLTPHPVLMSSVDFKAQLVSTGEQHSCALNENGIAWCWGSNKLVGSGDCFGQLGTGDDCTTLPRTNRPAIAVDRAEVQPLVRALKTRDNLNCMRNHAGQIYCWGSGANGQVGNAESLAENSAPTPLQGDTSPIHALGLSKCYACGLADDAMICWGDVADGCAGSGTKNQAEVLFDGYDFEPDACVSPGGCIAGGRAHTCFVDAAGSVFCFNDNAAGQLGADPSTARSSTPIEVTGLQGFVVQLTAGDQFSCALQSDGDVYCWGDNAAGQLGDASETSSFTPVKVALDGAAERISAGASHACAALDTGDIQCWGDNTHGQLGNGESGANKRSATPLTAQF